MNTDEIKQEFKKAKFELNDKIKKLHNSVLDFYSYEFIRGGSVCDFYNKMNKAYQSNLMFFSEINIILDEIQYEIESFEIEKQEEDERY